MGKITTGQNTILTKKSNRSGFKDSLQKKVLCIYKMRSINVHPFYPIDREIFKITHKQNKCCNTSDKSMCFFLNIKIFGVIFLTCSFCNFSICLTTVDYLGITFLFLLSRNYFLTFLTLLYYNMSQMLIYPFYINRSSFVHHFYILFITYAYLPKSLFSPKSSPTLF